MKFGGDCSCIFWRGLLKWWGLPLKDVNFCVEENWIDIDFRLDSQMLLCKELD